MTIIFSLNYYLLEQTATLQNQFNFSERTFDHVRPPLGNACLPGHAIGSEPLPLRLSIIIWYSNAIDYVGRKGLGTTPVSVFQWSLTVPYFMEDQYREIKQYMYLIRPVWLLLKHYFHMQWGKSLVHNERTCDDYKVGQNLWRFWLTRTCSCTPQALFPVLWYSSVENQDWNKAIRPLKMRV